MTRKRGSRAGICLPTAGRADDTDSGTEDDHSGKEQERLAFGGRRHGANDTERSTDHTIRFVPHVADYRNVRESLPREATPERRG